MVDSHRVIIIGEHPIRKNLEGQFLALGYEVSVVDNYGSEFMGGRYNDIVILSSVDTATPAIADTEAVKLLDQFSESLKEPSATRPVVHLLLQSQETLRMLNTREYKDGWHRKFELNAFTMDDVWAKNVVCPNRNLPLMYGLDYVPVMLESDHTVHLVVFGLSNLTTALVENVTLVAHYPNYTRDHQLRTRITVIDEHVSEWSRVFVSLHKSLMDNSYYRHVDVHTKHCDLHRPMYEGQREDFVDVEWEFVTGSIHDVVVQDKLLGWAYDEKQVLSVAICHDSDEVNFAEANLIGGMLVGSPVLIYLKQLSSAFYNIISQITRLGYVRLIGMKDSGYDITLPLLRMAKRIKYVYDYCYQYNIESETEGCITAPSFIDEATVDDHWLQEKRAIKRYSNLCNAMTLATKMRSLGHGAGKGNKFYAITKEEIDLIGQVEHNRWSVEEMLLGFRPCTDEEQAEVEADVAKKAEYKERLVHYDLRAYNDLRVDDTGKNVNTYDLCLSASIPLIAYEGKEETR